MSQPRYYWYGMVKKMIMRCPELESDSSAQALQYREAIKSAIEATKAMENGEDKMKAIEMVCFSRKYTIYGASDILHYSPRTIQRWINRFVDLVGKNVGF